MLGLRPRPRSARSCRQNFSYDTGPYDNLSDETPAKRYLIRGDYNLNSRNKISFRYNQLDSSTDKQLSGSTSAGLGRRHRQRHDFLELRRTRTTTSSRTSSRAVGEWNSVLGSTHVEQPDRRLHDQRREPRRPRHAVPVRRHPRRPDGTAYTSFGSEPFTPNNELRYQTFQLQDSFTKFGNKHALTFGGAHEKYHSDNVVLQLLQAERRTSTTRWPTSTPTPTASWPTRTARRPPSTLRRFQVRYINIPGLEQADPAAEGVVHSAATRRTSGAPRTNLTITGGVRVDVPAFERHGVSQPERRRADVP